MAPPANNSFLTATVIASLPYDFTQTDINDAGTNYTVYYTFVATATGMISSWGMAGDLASAYNPRSRPYNGPAGAPTLVLNMISETNRPMQFPVTQGNTYLLSFVKQADTAGPESLRVRVQYFTESLIRRGNIAVNDDSNGFPLVILSNSVDNSVIKFVQGMPAGEAGDILPDGTFVLENAPDDTIKIFNSTFVQVGSTLGPVTGDPRIRTCHGLSKWFLALNANPVVVRDILSTGAFGSVNKTTTLTSVLGVAASNDGTILYTSANSAASAIRRWDMVNNVALSDLAAGAANVYIVDIFVLADDTILTLHDNFSTGAITVKRWNASGTLLNTISVGTTVHEAGTFARGAYALDNPTSHWVMWHPAVGVSRFSNIRISDGAVLTQRDQTEYETGAYQQAETTAPTSLFGNSFSCPFFIIPVSNLAGLFTIVANKRTDNDGTSTSPASAGDVAIPNPTFKTGLMP